MSMAVGAAIYYCVKMASELIEPQGPAIFYVWLSGTLITPLVFGFFYPKRAWRWGIFVLVGQITFIVMTEKGDLNQLPIGIILYVVLAIPMLLSGTVGGFLARKKGDSKR